MPKKQARPPPDDPAQSERFMKDAAELMADDGPQLFERAMQTLASPTRLPAPATEPIIEKSKGGSKNRPRKKSGSAE